MPNYEPFDWYETPVYYDIIFDEDTDREAAFLEAVHARFATVRATGRRAQRRVLEPACGSGRLLTAMARRGWSVAGLDLSEGMIRFARSRLRDQGLRGSVRRAAMQDFAYPTKFDMAHCLVSTFKYLLTEQDAVAHLRCVGDALKPGGIYVLGLHLSNYESIAFERERWVAARDGVKVTCNIQGWPPDRRSRTERVRSRLIVERDKAIKRYQTEWTFRTYNLAQLRSLLRQAPQFEHVATYNFGYHHDSPIPLDGAWVDNVLVLRRRAWTSTV